MGLSEPLLQKRRSDGSITADTSCPTSPDDPEVRAERSQPFVVKSNAAAAAAAAAESKQSSQENTSHISNVGGGGVSGAGADPVTSIPAPPPRMNFLADGVGMYMVIPSLVIGISVHLCGGRFVGIAIVLFVAVGIIFDWCRVIGRPLFSLFLVRYRWLRYLYYGKELNLEGHVDATCHAIRSAGGLRNLTRDTFVSDTRTLNQNRCSSSNSSVKAGKQAVVNDGDDSLVPIESRLDAGHIVYVGLRSGYKFIPTSCQKTYWAQQSVFYIFKGLIIFLMFVASSAPYHMAVGAWQVIDYFDMYESIGPSYVSCVTGIWSNAFGSLDMSNVAHRANVQEQLILNVGQCYFSFALPCILVSIFIEMFVFHSGFLLKPVSKYIYDGDDYTLADTLSSIMVGMLSAVAPAVLPFILDNMFYPYFYDYVYGNVLDASSALGSYNPLAVFSIMNSFVIFWLAVFAADMSYYLLHRTCHVWSYMWTAHSVHHSTEHFNLCTGVREGLFWLTPYYVPFPLMLFVPLDIAKSSAMVAAVYPFILHSLVCFHTGWRQVQHIVNDDYRTGLDAPSKRRSDVSAGEKLDVMSYWRIRDVYMSSFELWFNNGNLHRLHHARNHELLSLNYTSTFAIVDRMFGTYWNFSHQRLNLMAAKCDAVLASAAVTAGLEEEFTREGVEVVSDATATISTQHHADKYSANSIDAALLNTPVRFGVVPVMRSWTASDINFETFRHLFLVQTRQYGQNFIQAMFVHWTPPGKKCPPIRFDKSKAEPTLVQTYDGDELMMIQNENQQHQQQLPQPVRASSKAVNPPDVFQHPGYTLAEMSATCARLGFGHTAQAKILSLICLPFTVFHIIRNKVIRPAGNGITINKHQQAIDATHVYISVEGVLILAFYSVPLMVTDLSHFGGVQTVTLYAWLCWAVFNVTMFLQISEDALVLNAPEIRFTSASETQWKYLLINEIARSIVGISGFCCAVLLSDSFVQYGQFLLCIFAIHLVWHVSGMALLIWSCRELLAKS